MMVYDIAEFIIVGSLLTLVVCLTVVVVGMTITYWRMINE